MARDVSGRGEAIQHVLPNRFLGAAALSWLAQVADSQKHTAFSDKEPSRFHKKADLFTISLGKFIKECYTPFFVKT